METDITMPLMQRYYEAGKLGNIVERIPGCGIVSVDLSKLFRYSTGLKCFKAQTKPGEIETIAIYGSTLYKSFPTTERVEMSRRKYLLFGPKETRTKTIEYKRELPNDFDVMVITKKSFTKDRVIVPKRHIEGDSYGSWEVIDSTAVETERLESDGYGYFEVMGAANLHITYRSVKQFLRGIGNGDELSESVVRYGIPLIGNQRFEQIVGKASVPKRRALHSVSWNEDLEGKLQAKITQVR